MSVGFPSSKNDLDSRAGSLVVAARDSLYNCSQFCAKLQNFTTLTDAAMITLGYSQAEVTTMKSGFLDLGGTGNSLYRIANGLAFVGSNNDFFFNAKLLTGVI